MAFRARNKSFCLVGGWSAFESVDSQDSDGVVQKKVYSPHSDHLPPIESFELDTLLKAGVSLQQTRSKILPSDVTPILDGIAEATARDMEQINNNNKE